MSSATDMIGCPCRGSGTGSLPLEDIEGHMGSPESFWAKNYSVDEGLFDAFWHGPEGPKHGETVNWTEVGRMCNIRKVRDSLPFADNSLGSVLKK